MAETKTCLLVSRPRVVALRGGLMTLTEGTIYNPVTKTEVTATLLSVATETDLDFQL